MVQVDIAALRSIEREKEISFDMLISALEAALLTAYKHTAHSMPHASQTTRSGCSRTVSPSWIRRSRHRPNCWLRLCTNGGPG